MSVAFEGRDLQRARLERRSKWTWLWILPAIALGVAAWLLWRGLSPSGRLVHVRFDEAQGVSAGTKLKCLGVDVGEVEKVRLADDMRGVWLDVRLNPGAEDVAAADSRFWIVAPSFELGDMQALGRILDGPYVAVSPGRGPPEGVFDGQPRPPGPTGIGDELEILLLAAERGNLKAGSPILYRGLEIGELLAPVLSDDARVVRFPARIARRYAPLVRVHSRFWRIGEPELEAGLGGLQMEARSWATLVSGALALGTPDADEPAARDGIVFRLHEKPEDEWTLWDPKIPLADEPPQEAAR